MFEKDVMFDMFMERFADPCHPRNIVDAEWEINTLFTSFGPERVLKEPVLAVTLINEKETLATLWRSEVDGKIHYYPTAEPACPEFKCTNPAEWDVFFIGKLGQLKETPVAEFFKTLPDRNPSEHVAVMVVKKDLIGFKRQPMRQQLFLCSVIIPAYEGRLCYPTFHWHQP